jgi:hypothetical protein
VDVVAEFFITNASSLGNGLGLWFQEVYTNPFPGFFAVYVLGLIFFPVTMTYIIPYSVFQKLSLLPHVYTVYGFLSFDRELYCDDVFVTL